MKREAGARDVQRSTLSLSNWRNERWKAKWCRMSQVKFGRIDREQTTTQIVAVEVGEEWPKLRE